MKHKPWFKTWQDRIRSDRKYRVLNACERGSLFDLMQLCGREGDEKFSTTVQELALEFNLTEEAAFKCLEILSQNGWIKCQNFPASDTKQIFTLQLVGWNAAQEPSPESKRVLAWRDRRNQGIPDRRNSYGTVAHDSDVTVTVEGEGEGEPLGSPVLGKSSGLGRGRRGKPKKPVEPEPEKALPEPSREEFLQKAAELTARAKAIMQTPKYKRKMEGIHE